MRKVRCLLLVACLLLLVPQEAEATSFLLDPSVGIPFGRVLWNVQPDKNGVVELKYTFVSEAPDVNFKWEDSSGAVTIKKNKDFTENQKKAINAAATEWNAQVGMNNNLIGKDIGGKYDLQSTALHEFGHVLGLGHPNVGAGDDRASHLKGPNGVDDMNANKDGVEGTVDDTWGPDQTPGTADDADDIITNFNVPANNISTNPAGKVDSTTLKPSAKVSTAGPTRPLAPGTKGTEAVMLQGSVKNELQRDLSFDDIQGLRALQSGRDFIESTEDDFVFKLIEVGEDEARHINIINLDLGGITGLTRSILDGTPTPNVHQVRDFFDISRDDFLLTSLTDIWFESENPNYPGDIGFAEVFIDMQYLAIPEPNISVLLGIALFSLFVAWRRRKY